MYMHHQPPLLFNIIGKNDDENKEDQYEQIYTILAIGYWKHYEPRTNGNTSWKSD